MGVTNAAECQVNCSEQSWFAKMHPINVSDNLYSHITQK